MSDLFTATTAAEVAEFVAHGDNLEEVRDEKTPFLTALQVGNIDVALALLQHGAKPLSPENGPNVVHISALIDRADLLEALVKAGANVDELDYSQGTALTIAAQNGFVDLAAKALTLGATTELQNGEGWTPLIGAASAGFSEIVDLLLPAGANVNVASRGGDTPLTSAAFSGHVSVVNSLLDHGANVNHQNNDGWTALIGATITGQVEIVEKLVSLGCDLNVQEKNGGKTALATAAESANKDIVKILLAHGADTQLKDFQGQTAFDLTYDDEIKALLQEHESKKP